MVARNQLNDTEKSALAKVAVEPQTVGTLPADDVTHLIDRNMMEEVMGHYVITPKGQLELRRHVYRRRPFREASAPTAPGDPGDLRAAPLSKAQSSSLRSFWSWLQGPRRGGR